MDPNRFNTFPSDRQDGYHPALAEQQSGQGRQADEAAHRSFEQRLDEVQQADAAPVPAAPAPRDRYTPNLSNEDASLIDNAIRSAGERRGLSAATVVGYVAFLRRLGEDLARNGQSISALDDDSLAAHANKFDDTRVAALRYLREYLEPGATLGRSQRGRRPGGNGVFQRKTRPSSRPQLVAASDPQRRLRSIVAAFAYFLKRLTARATELPG